MFNKSLVQGNLVRDPEFAQTNSQTTIVNFTVATSRKYKQKEETAFIDCTAYGQTAENIAKFFTKGDPLGVEGRISQGNWEDQQTGQKRSKLYITVDAFHFVGPTGQSGQRGGQRGGQGGGQRQKQGRGQNRGQQNQEQGQGGYQQGNQNQGQQGGQPFDEDVEF